MPLEHETTLSLGEWAVSADPTSVLACLGLGSCVAFVAYDAAKHIGGMAHMVLPDSTMGRPSELAPAKFVDLAIPIVVERVLQLGAQHRNLQVHLLGGSCMLKGQGGMLNIGERNIQAARSLCQKLGLRITSEDVGGNHGRTVRLHVGTGELTRRGAGIPAARLAA